MSSPRTGTIGVQRPVPAVTGGGSRWGVRSAVHAVGAAAVAAPARTVGALAVVVTALFSWVPALWYDEVATVSSTQRSLPELWAELHHVDAVHGLYYAVMHCWFWLVGYSPFTLRFPSAVAIGIAAALVVAIGRQLGGTRLGVVSGIVFVVLPRVAWAGGEGRPYAMVAMFAAAITAIGLTAVRRSGSRSGLRWWIAYAAVAAVGVVCNVYLALVVVAHGVVLGWNALAARSGSPRGAVHVERATMLRWLAASGAAAIAVSPFVVAASRQTKQVSWIEGIDGDTVRQVFQTAWFGGQPVYAAIAWTLMAFAVVSAVIAGRRRHADARDRLRADALRVILPLAFFPMAALLLVTALGEHLWSPKYATMSLPFVALLIGLALTAVRPRRWLAAAVLVAVLGSVPTSVAVRTEYAKQDSHWGDVAAYVASERSSHQDSDEGVVFGSVWRHPSATAQAVAVAYPDAFAGMTDLAVGRTAAERGTLWDENGDIATTVPARLGDIDTVWYLGGPSRSVRPEVTRTLEAQGFVAARHEMIGKIVIVRFDRTR